MRDSSGKKIYIVYSFLSYVKGKVEPGLYFQQAGYTSALNPQLFCQQTDKKTLL